MLLTDSCLYLAGLIMCWLRRSADRPRQPARCDCCIFWLRLLHFLAATAAFSGCDFCIFWLRLLHFLAATSYIFWLDAVGSALISRMITAIFVQEKLLLHNWMAARSLSKSNQTSTQAPSKRLATTTQALQKLRTQGELMGPKCVENSQGRLIWN